ncbi:hypothetical protein SIL77_08525 [Exiguobacterium profundum]|nr:hypothetical protein [Exiguobacterium profundum]MDX5981305.1 hypothetical protein [Exiguobacterium profundum]
MLALLHDMEKEFEIPCYNREVWEAEHPEVGTLYRLVWRSWLN